MGYADGGLGEILQRAGHDMFTPTVKEIAGWNRSELELAFRESQQRLTDMVENAPIPVVLQDLASHYVLANQWARAQFWHGRDMVGTTPFDVWPPETAARFAARLREVIESQRPSVSEDVLPSPDGERTMLIHRFPLRDLDGGTSLIAAIGVDITAQKRAEADARDAERANRANSESLLHISGQLRSPLNDVVAYAQQLQTEDLSPSAADRVEGIVTAAGRLLALIDELPAPTHVETGSDART
jgi:PAS domain S-box-containing protein